MAKNGHGVSIWYAHSEMSVFSFLFFLFDKGAGSSCCSSIPSRQRASERSI